MRSRQQGPRYAAGLIGIVLGNATLPGASLDSSEDRPYPTREPLFGIVARFAGIIHPEDRR